MELVQPRVYKIADMSVNQDQLLLWLQSMGGEECLAYMKEDDDLSQLVQVSAKRCYKSFKPGLNPNVSRVRTDSDEYIENILKSGHGSVLEHASVTFAFENISRVFTHEVVRHRAGVAISQESLRFVRLTDIKFWIPAIFGKYGEEKRQRALEVIKRTVEACESAQKDFADIFEIEKMQNFDEKKALTSAFRRCAPIGLATGIVLTFNLRALRHILQMRTAASAEEEMRLVFGQIAEIVKKDYPQFFADFEKIDTKDGFFEYRPLYKKV